MGFRDWFSPSPPRSESDDLEALRALAEGRDAPVTRREQPRDEIGRFAPGDGTELEQPEWAAILVGAAEAVKDLGARVEQIESGRTQGRAVARAAGYTDEGLTNLEKFMHDNGVTDHALAMPAFERANPPPEPVMTGMQRVGLIAGSSAGGDIDLKPLFDGNEEGFLSVAVPAALRHVRGW